MDYEIDELDREILRKLMRDARKPYLEIARELEVSGGTIHARVARMKENGVIRGTRLDVNFSVLGYGISAFVGLKRSRESDTEELYEFLKAIPQIVEVYSATGRYSLIAKIIAKDINELWELLSVAIHKEDRIQTTESMVILDVAFEKQLEI